MSDNQDVATAMLASIQQRRIEKQDRQRKAREMKQQAVKQIKLANDKDLTNKAAQMLERYQQRQREQGRDGLKY